MKRSSIALSAAVLLASCATRQSASTNTIADAVLIGPDGSGRGTAQLTLTGDVVTLSVAGVHLPPGVHGIHLHAVGTCDAPAFTSAGPHLNPFAKMHGATNPLGSHLGDLPNLTVAADGTTTLSTGIAGASATLLPQVFDADGTSVMIHAAADDYVTDPSGNSGARIACGVLVKRT